MGYDRKDYKKFANIPKGTVRDRFAELSIKKLGKDAEHDLGLMGFSKKEIRHAKRKSGF